ncbi:hypothetical protein LZ32DRAFT_611493 [Colletotrichum eremochloae]|nr:hypothetical protein LZ32DRAFT_611493 [Colletotrichum eremochloae]
MKLLADRFIPSSFSRQEGQILMFGTFRNSSASTEVSIYDLVPGGKYQELIDTDGIRPKTTRNLVLCPEYLARVRRLQIQIMEHKGTPHSEDLDQVAMKQFEIYTLREMGLADYARPNLDWDAKFKEWREDKLDFNEWLKSQDEMAEPSIRTSVTAAAMGEHIKRKAETDLRPEEGNKRLMKE